MPLISATEGGDAKFPLILVPRPDGRIVLFALGSAQINPTQATALIVASPIACTAPAEFSRLDHPLQHMARRLASGEPLTIVAIGSSSTAGAGASSPAASYPSRLAVELKQRFPGNDIFVLNRGVNGDETDQMMARFKTGVFAEHPQLVLWQVGANTVLHDHPLRPHSAQLQEGIDELKATGTDVVLIDPQFTPKVLAKSETPGMVDQIALAAKENNVDLFRRFAVMRDWYEIDHLPFDAFVSPDGLHMNDWSYACVAKLLAGAIAEAASRPIASAAAHLAAEKMRGLQSQNDRHGSGERHRSFPVCSPTRFRKVIVRSCRALVGTRPEATRDAQRTIQGDDGARTENRWRKRRTDRAQRYTGFQEGFLTALSVPGGRISPTYPHRGDPVYFSQTVRDDRVTDHAIIVDCCDAHSMSELGH